jgi:hypothetical protein
MIKVTVVEHNGTKHKTEVGEWNAAVAKKYQETIKEAQGHSDPEHTVIIGDVIIDARSVNSISKSE